MEILIVRFKLEGMTEAEYLRMCDQEAPTFAEVPGMVSKVWLADPETNTYGGVYTFRDRAALDDYLASDLFKAIAAIPGLADATASRFGVLDGPTQVTRGGIVAAA